MRISGRNLKLDATCVATAIAAAFGAAAGLLVVCAEPPPGPRPVAGDGPGIHRPATGYEVAGAVALVLGGGAIGAAVAWRYPRTRDGRRGSPPRT